MRWAWIALVCFCFAQFAVAAYVCPPAGDGVQSASTPSGDGDCHRAGNGPHDTENASLCKAHCERDAQAKPSTPVDQPHPAHVAAPFSHLRMPTAASHERPVSCLPPHGGPPLYLRHCVLRN